MEVIRTFSFPLLDNNQRNSRSVLLISNGAIAIMCGGFVTQRREGKCA